MDSRYPFQIISKLEGCSIRRISAANLEKKIHTLNPTPSIVAG